MLKSSALVADSPMLKIFHYTASLSTRATKLDPMRSGDEPPEQVGAMLKLWSTPCKSLFHSCPEHSRY